MMDRRTFDISDGLTQERRKFKELVEGFYAVDRSSLRDYLNVLKEISQKNTSLDILGGVDIDDLVRQVEGEASGETEPSVAVYVACASLLLRVKDRLNCLPDRRIDYYYEKVLGEKQKGVEGDSAHVVFTKPAVGTNCTVAAGTRFWAGSDENGKDIEFEAVKDSCINDVSVARLMTFAVRKDVPASVAEIPVYPPKEALESREMTPYPLFGMTRSGHSGTGAEYARFGLGVTSPILNLRDGRRKIKVKLFFDSEPVNSALRDKQERSDEFLKTFSNAFRIQLTTETGWHEVEGYQVKANILGHDLEPNCIGLDFALTELVPPIVNYDPEVHGDAFDCCHPVMKIELNPRVSYSPWSYLCKLKLMKVELEVKVKFFRLLEASNEMGNLDLSTPVQLFGPLPQIGNTFSFSCEEFEGKKLTDLDLIGKWHGLPHKQSFAKWYSGYPTPPENADFKVSICSWNKGIQNPSENQKPLVEEMFFDGEGEISDVFHISFKDVLDTVSAKTKFKLRLHSPEKAFWHQDYSKVMCRALMLQSIKKFTSVELPNQPYTPELEDVYVNYQAKCEINMQGVTRKDESQKAFFLGPWGYDFDNMMIADGGALYIGLSSAKCPKNVNLYFHLKHDSDYVVSEDLGEFEWSVLCRDGWVKLLKESVLYNTTAGFTTSGIVSLLFPNKMVSDSTSMPDGLFWVCVRPLNDWAHCSRLYSVYAQGLEVKRCIKESQNMACAHVEAGVIKRLTKSSEGLSEVCQLERSFGGRMQETRTEMRTRVAETLYHRGRAFTCRDYERLVLENFPEVYMVKCFPGIKSNGYGRYETEPGSLTIVPVSKKIEAKGASYDPHLGGKMLNDIKVFLSNHSPASANIRVINPLFEKIQVRCNVDIVDRFNEGESLNDLNEKINQFISPWYNIGINTIFGWTLDEDKLKQFIRELEYVQRVNDLSIFRIVSSDTSKYVVDYSEKDGSKIMRGMCPWSVATPMSKHYLNIVDDIDNAKRLSTGFGGLEIGSTFVIQKER